MVVSRTLGELTVIALDDGDGPHFDRREDAIPAATPQDWAAADTLDPAALAADGRWWLRFWSYAIRYGEGPVTLVDAGIGPARSLAAQWAPVPGRLPAELAVAGIAPGDVETIVPTRLHDDHIGWAVPADSPFTEARVVVVQRADVRAPVAVTGERPAAGAGRCCRARAGRTGDRHAGTYAGASVGAGLVGGQVDPDRRGSARARRSARRSGTGLRL